MELYCTNVKVSPEIEGAKELPVAHFWSHLFQLFPLLRFNIHLFTQDFL